MISQFTRFDEMSDGEEGTEHDTDSTDDDVGDSEEGVLAAHYGAGADYDGFGTAVVGYVEVCLLVRCETEGILGWGWGVWERTVVDVKGISSSNHSLIIIPLSQLAECGQARKTHPNLEWLIVLQIGMEIIGISRLWEPVHPVRWNENLRPVVFGWSIECFITFPGDSFVHFHVVGSVVDCWLSRGGWDVQENRVEERVIED